MTDFTIERLGPHLKYHPLYRDGYEKTVCVMKIVEAILPYLGSIFKLPPQVKFKVGLIKQKGGNAEWSPKGNTCLVDARRVKSVSDAVNSILHEMTHAEQYHTGVLEQKREQGKWVHCWNDRPFGKAFTHNAYWNRPWEIEAREKAEKFKDIVTERLLNDSKTQLWDDKFTLTAPIASDLKRRKSSRRRQIFTGIVNVFAIGDSVTFTARGQQWVGRVSSRNQKTYSVICINGKWRVPPHMLRKS